MAYAGLRFGFSSFNYSLTGVTVDNGYWGETETMDFPRQHCSLVYMNLLFGIRVKIAGPVSLGWQFRFKTRLHESENPMGKPWYIPGYGPQLAEETAFRNSSMQAPSRCSIHSGSPHRGLPAPKRGNELITPK